MPTMPEDERSRDDYSDRLGYDPLFLDADVPLPWLSDAVRAKAFRRDSVAGREAYELKYHHFSVIMNREVRLAFVAAVNYDGSALFRHTRAGGDRWIADPRVGVGLQAGDEFYSDNALDRGHLVRRTDAAWGVTADEARKANDDTFHFTNCSPQHEVFNQARRAAKQDLLLWGNLEEHIAAQAGDPRQRLSIFNGPVFRATDRLHRGLAVPREFWKIVAYRRSSGDPPVGAVAFLLSQQGLIRDLPLEDFAAGPYRTFQVRIQDLEALTGLDFGPLRSLDPIAAQQPPGFESGAGGKPLSALADIVL